MKATGAVLAGVAVLAFTALVSNVVRKAYFSPSKSQGYPVAKKASVRETINNVKELINPENMRTTLHSLVKTSHVAGTENNLKIAQIIRNKMINQGLEDVHFNEYNVLLSYPNWTNPNTVEILAEDGKTVYKTSGRSEPIVKEEQNDPTAEIQWFAYSANGIAEGDIVYVNKGTYADMEHLKGLGIDLKDKIFLARYSGSFRGNIAQVAVKMGAKGCLVYSDPIQVASLGTGPNETYSATDKMPPHAVQRGTVFIGLGDPRTPAFPSIGGLYKEKTEEELYSEKVIPTIPILPIPYSDAKIIFENMKGDAVIPDFQGKLNVTYRYGPGLVNNQKLRMTVHARNEERKIQNILGFIRGSQEPHKFVIVSNHYDAWTYGAIDPNSGTSALLEVSRTLMEYQNKTGWKPARSILFAHWDAEEYGLTGSTEFAEEYRVQLMRRAVAVVNMDFIGGNQSILALANPTMASVLREATSNTVHPNQPDQNNRKKTLYDTWKELTPSTTNRSTHPNVRIPAGGSDHMPFFNYLGIPIIFFITNSVDAAPAYPLYHTIYETPFLTEKILDPEFKMHKAVAEMFVDLTLQLTENKIIPYDLQELMDEMLYTYLPKIEAKIVKALELENVTSYLEPGVNQLSLLLDTVRELSSTVNQRNITILESLPLNERVNINDRLIEFEKCFINPSGMLGNFQTRHILFNPSPDDWYSGHPISQVHDLISKLQLTQDEKELKKLSRRLAQEIATVNFAFICAKHSLDDLIRPF